MNKKTRFAPRPCQSPGAGSHHVRPGPPPCPNGGISFLHFHFFIFTSSSSFLSFHFFIDNPASRVSSTPYPMSASELAVWDE